MIIRFRILSCLLLALASGLVCADGSLAARNVVPSALDPSSAFKDQRISLAEKTLSLKKIERKALEQNLGLRAELFTSKAAEALVKKGYGIYDPELNLFWSEGQARDLLNFQFFVGRTGADTRDVNASLNQKLSFGTELSLFYTNRRQSLFTDPKPVINPEYQLELGLSLVQPLLKDFGRTVTEQDILFAVKDQEASVEDLRRVALDLLMEVQTTYFNILKARDDLDYRTTSVELARTVLKENRARVDAGVLPPVEVLEAEVGVQSRERDRLDAERAYHDALDTMALLLNSQAVIEIAGGSLEQPVIATDEQAAYQIALEKRPELQAQIRQIEKLQIERDVKRNQILPTVDLVASYSHKGVGQEYSDAADFIPRTDIRNWQVGINVNYPIGNRAARSDLSRTKLRLRSQQSSIGQLRDQIRNDIRRAIRLLEVSRAKISAATIERQLAEEKLRILIGRKDVGLATTRDVLEGEEDLARARTDQTAALAAYNIALSGYYRSTGELLENEGIHLQRAEGSLADQPFVMD